MINKLNNNSKQTGDELSAQEWNQISGKVDELVEAYNTGGNTTVIDASGILSTNDKGNVTLGNNSIKNVNIEPGYPRTGTDKYGDIALKPGDDIQFASHHREPNKRDKVVLKVLDGSDNPVKFEVHSGEISLSTKNKELTKKKDSTTGEDTANTLFKSGDEKTLDLKILTGVTLGSKANDDERDERGYLKVRAQAIDLRCEKHGGIALQPKGYDGEGNMNKIKFEHGGGDGLEFGTFNTEKTSLYTDEYRFKRDGIWKMATRQTTASGKTIYDDNTPNGKQSTGAYKYVKQADDFYDIINSSDEQCTTKDIIKTAWTFNGAKNRHAKTTKKGAIEIATNETYVLSLVSSGTDTSSAIQIDTIAKTQGEFDSVASNNVFNDGDFQTLPLTDGTIYTNGTQYFTFEVVAAPNIKIESGGELKLGGTLDFGSSFGFGETDDGIYTQYKLTKNDNLKDCGILKVIAVNNHATNNIEVDNYIIHPGEQQVIEECPLIDIMKFTRWAIRTRKGPWQDNSIELYDFNNDGEITVVEFAILTNAILDALKDDDPNYDKNNKTYNGKSLDINNDGTIDTADLIELIDIISDNGGIESIEFRNKMNSVIDYYDTYGSWPTRNQIKQLPDDQ